MGRFGAKNNLTLVSRTTQSLTFNVKASGAVVCKFPPSYIYIYIYIKCIWQALLSKAISNKYIWHLEQRKLLYFVSL